MNNGKHKEPQHDGPVRPKDGTQDAGDRRWRLIGDVAVFQGKLLLDGLRDLILSPLSVGAALIGIATNREEPGRHFYALMRWGRWSDRRINLFNAKGDRTAGSPDTEEAADSPNVDQVADELERVLIERYARSALAQAAKGSIDRGLDRVSANPVVDRESLRAAARRITRGFEQSGLARLRAPRKPDGGDDSGIDPEGRGG